MEVRYIVHLRLYMIFGDYILERGTIYSACMFIHDIWRLYDENDDIYIYIVNVSYITW
jgi:hypothetical protein